ncbi:MAG: histidine--tRNA ligase [Clostridia bacterium]|nr:histidine--tRNA ligase [Clostridia bacterium]
MINIPKGTKDVLPDQSYKWRFIEDTAREVARAYNLKEIRTPTFEYTELFQRGVGETTDVVNKEMYTFEDKHGRSITLKPEGTAGAVRMFIENGLASSPLPVKTYYFTPAFRYERPQAGRLREFHQFGIEIFGSKSPDTDAEVIFAASSFLKKLGLKDYRLEINSIGCPTCRAAYNKALREYFEPRKAELCPTCQERLEKNPLRILDCKEEKCQEICEDAPRILDFLCDDCATHFDKVRHRLDSQGMEYTVNPDIVRGLDYYTKTVFEFVSTKIGAQGTICGGGRYDNLVEQLGGPSVPAIGFAAGIERLMMLMENTGCMFLEPRGVDIYLAGADGAGRDAAMALAETLRAAGICAETDHMERSVKGQLKFADKIGARFVAVIGSSEIESKTLKVKRMSDGTEAPVQMDGLADFMKRTVFEFMMAQAQALSESSG